MSILIIAGLVVVGLVGGVVIGLLIGGPFEPEPTLDIDPTTEARMQALATSLQMTLAAWQTEREMMAATLREMQGRG